jgi:hypothetical protein
VKQTDADFNYDDMPKDNASPVRTVWRPQASTQVDNFACSADLILSVQMLAMRLFWYSHYVWYFSQWLGDDKDDGAGGFDGKEGAGGFDGKGMEDAELDAALRKNGMGGGPEEIDLSAGPPATSETAAEMGDA